MAKADGFEEMQGHVEIDEAFIGGYRSHGGPQKGDNKTIVLGIVERGGRISAKSVPNLKAATVRPFIYESVKAGSAVSTDESAIYELLKSAGYDHKAVNHSKKQWRKFNYRRDEYHHTNSVESFWRLFKNSIRSTHIHVSEKYMDRYLKEFTFRSNHRQMSNAMFDLLIASV
jgi:transposase-like protein